MFRKFIFEFIKPINLCYFVAVLILFLYYVSFLYFPEWKFENISIEISFFMKKIRTEQKKKHSKITPTLEFASTSLTIINILNKKKPTRKKQLDHTFTTFMVSLINFGVYLHCM